MYQDFVDCNTNKSIQICLLGRGNEQRKFNISLNHQMNLRDIRHNCEFRWRREFKKLRLFNQDGVELFDEDVQFVKDKSKLYVSLGEDFDANIIYSEFEIIRELGKGGFGEVLLGQHKETKQMVAIKIVNANTRNASEIELVFREAYLLKSLVHKNIVKFYNCLPLQNMQVIMVMEYLEGGDLRKYLECKKQFLKQAHTQLSEDEARIYFKQICEAIMYCHQRKLIHRDLKLENIMFANKDDNILKIVDFGIAGIALNTNTDKLNIGTIRYMAPETFNEYGKIGTNIDIWALGVILYVLVTGIMPFNGSTPSEILQKILSVDYEFPQNQVLSHELIDLISRIFIFDVNKRIKMFEILNHDWMVGQIENLQSPPENNKKVVRLAQINQYKLNSLKLPPLHQTKFKNRSQTPIRFNLNRTTNSSIMAIRKLSFLNKK